MFAINLQLLNRGAELHRRITPMYEGELSPQAEARMLSRRNTLLKDATFWVPEEDIIVDVDKDEALVIVPRDFLTQLEKTGVSYSFKQIHSVPGTRYAVDVESSESRNTLMELLAVTANDWFDQFLPEPWSMEDPEWAALANECYNWVSWVPDWADNYAV